MPEVLGTLIAGAPRSGTTLALKTLCDGLTPQDVIEGGVYNEPGELWELIEGWGDSARDTVAEANGRLPQLVQRSRYHVVKSPHISPLFATLDPRYRVILTFRDLRLVVASMLNHEQTRFLALDAAEPYWVPMLKEPQDVSKMNVVQRALVSAEMFTRYGVDYRGEMQVWSYGFWDEWECNTEDISALYSRAKETSQRMCDEMAKGVIFSDLSFTMDAWNEACDKHKISKDEAAAVEAANARMVKLYSERGFAVKTLDDVAGAAPAESLAVPAVPDDCITVEDVLPAICDLTANSLQRVEKTWGKPGYPTDWIKLPSQRRWEYETAIKLLGVPEGSRVLDAGGGSGYMSYILSSHFAVTFNDRHDCYNQPPAPVQKIIGSFFTLPEHELFDAIACVSVFEHVPPGQRAQWLDKTFRLLKPGGVAAFTFEWHPSEVFDIGDGHTLTSPQLSKLWAGTPLKVTAQLISPTKAPNSRGWLPLAVQLVKE